MTKTIRQQVKALPLKPGVYFFKAPDETILYIGKAKELRKRVSSYFAKTYTDKTGLLVKEATSIEFIVTDTEVEALILEARLIRQHKPKYNIDLKNGVRYAYLKFTNQDFPRLLTVRKREKDQAQYFGPFTDGTGRENSARLLRSIFKVRTCGEKLPKKVCLQFYLGNCDAPCIANISKEEYKKNVDVATSVLRGKTKMVIKQLETEMKRLSEKKMFEQAKTRRDQIRALRKFGQRQKIEMHKQYNEDVLHWINIGEKVYVQLFRVEKGNISGKQEFTFESGPEIIEQFIRQYYQTNEIPDMLIIPRPLKEQDLIAAYLTKIKGKKVSIDIPYRGRKKKILDLVYRNILFATEQEDQSLLNLRDHLNLPGVPYVIECFDISTIQGSFNVASMVQFRGGVPDKSNYRRFKIKTVQQQDDFASMAEVVRRRYTRLLKEKKPVPDLIVVDGGRGQLNAAWEVLKDLEVKVPIIGLAKKEEEIYRVETIDTLKLSKKEPGLKLLIQLRDEAHRFAITYHRLLRKKGMKN